MPADAPIKALLCALVTDFAPAVYLINRLQPDTLCFFAPETSRALIEQRIQTHLAQMPRRWDWVVTPEPQEFPSSHEALARRLPELLDAWGVHPGELVMGIADATAAMSAAMTLVGVRTSSRMIQLFSRSAEGSEAHGSPAEDQWRWVQGNPWDEEAASVRREANDLFNRGEYVGAAYLFRQLEIRVSGGQKPLYHALGDMAEGYGLWSRFQHRAAWEKLKTAAKSLEMAAVWGGPPGLKALLPLIKANAGFLERLTMDSLEVKECLTLELLGQAARLTALRHHNEIVMRSVIRALESAAQWKLFKQHQIKSWDVQPEQLPDGMQAVCRSGYLSEVDGKYKLPIHAQFQVLAELGEELGRAYLAQWPKMKPLFDAADQAILGHGVEAVKPERCQQLFDITMKLMGLTDAALPKFPVLAL
ncbi:hypothetical protein YTPLAS18_38330 [Nitrospira sp.]|nr:hypothetical protein YTPLAS18_38330 [Nitrospira sp.]